MKNQIWKHNKSGDMYIVEVKDGEVVRCQGPLHHTEVEDFRNQGVLDNQPEDVEWMNENSENFSLA